MQTRDRSWFTPTALLAWLVALAFVAVTGFLAWITLGSGLCEDDGSPGSDAYCNRGGWEASGLAIAAVIASAVLVPAVGITAAKRRLFWTGVLASLPLPVLVAVLSVILGRD